MIDWDDYPNFSESEFRCHCGCGRADMDPDFLGKLQDMRDRARFPFRVNSGFRCPDYNEDISSTGRNGPHTTGHAADIGVAGEHAYTFARLAYSVGMFGIGFKQHGDHAGRYIHIDDLETPPRPNIWSYPEE